MYKVALHEGKATYVYVLFEHKSYSDDLIAFQLLRYMVRIWEQNLKQKQPLLPILPLVIYHGRSRWRVPLEFEALLETPEALKPYVPAYRYWVCDLSQYGDEEIQGVIILRVGLLLLKYILRPDLRHRLGEIIGLLRAISERQTGLEYLETILRYVASSAERVSEEELRQVGQTGIRETLLPLQSYNYNPYSSGAAFPLKSHRNYQSLSLVSFSGFLSSNSYIRLSLF